MCGQMQAASAGFSAVSAYQRSQADKNAYEYQAAISRNNAAYDEFARADAIRRGQREAGNSRLKYAALKGSQRARLAANGVDVNSGSASNILQDTQYFSDVDAATTQDNAIRQAWGFEVQKTNDLANGELLQGRANAEVPWKAAVGSLLGNGMTVSDSWYMRSGTQAPVRDAYPTPTGRG